MLRQFIVRTCVSRLKIPVRYTGNVITDDEIDELLDYPNLDIDTTRTRKPFEGHNLVVIQPWVSYANFGEFETDPDLQLAECVSLGNTIHNWNVIGKKILFTQHLHRKQLVGKKTFEDLKDLIYSHKGVSAVLFGVELLSGVQLSTLERDLRLPVYDRFTIVLNIFRQHAQTKEAKIQIALAELPYIRSHLREIHESSEFSSSAESLKLLIGGIGEKFYHQRVNILKKREIKLKQALLNLQKQRILTQQQRKKGGLPTVSVVGYTNSGKTTLIKYLTEDKNLVPKDQLFATLDVSSHLGQLPSCKSVAFVDTVGFLSRIPVLLIQAFSATLREVQESDLIVHILDVTHPDYKLQYATVTKALQALKIPQRLLGTKVVVGNKSDMLVEDPPKDFPKCDIFMSATEGSMDLVNLIDKKLSSNLDYQILNIKVENGGERYTWLRKNSTILSWVVDETDANYLNCRVSMSPVAYGRWMKHFEK